MTAENPNVSWSETALAEAITAAEQALPNETGGILAGWYVEDVIHVDRFIHVPDKRAHRFGYLRRSAEANAALAQAKQQGKQGAQLGYVGEWHSHPAAAGPSRTDVLSLKCTAYLSAEPLVLVVLARTEDGWKPHVRVARSRRVARRSR